MASPDHDVSRRGGDVGPHRHLEDQTDHLLFFCHLSSPVAKHYSHASCSLRIPCGICYSAPNICSSNYCGIGGSHRVASANSPACKGKSLRCLRKCRSSYIDTSPALSALRHLTAALRYSARPPQRPSRSHLGYQIHQTYCLPTSSEPPPPRSVACCAHEVQKFDLDQKVLVPGPVGPWFQQAKFWRR